MNEEKQSIVPKWLTELQQRSWEPEILLSGIVLYGMFKVPDLLDDFLVGYLAGADVDLNALNRSASEADTLNPERPVNERAKPRLKSSAVMSATGATG